MPNDPFILICYTCRKPVPDDGTPCCAAPYLKYVMRNTIERDAAGFITDCEELSPSDRIRLRRGKK
jgi:hypothetical protein